MPSPKLPSRLSPLLADIYQRLQGVAEPERTTALVDYLDDLCLEVDWVSVELKELGFCVTSYLEGRGNGDSFDYVGMN